MKLGTYIRSRFKEAKLRQYFAIAPALSDMLPYEDLIVEDGKTFVFLKNGSLGLGVEVQWPNHLTSSDRVLVDLEATICRFLKRVDHSYQLQFQLSKQEDGFHGYLFLTSPKGRVKTSLLPARMQKTGLASFRARGEQMTGLLENFSFAIQGEGSRCQPMDEEKLLRLLSYRLGETERQWKSLRSVSVMSGQVSGTSLRIGEKNYSAIVPVSLPAVVASQVLRPIYFEQANFLISVGLRVLSREETELRISKRKFWLQNALGAGAARLREEIESFEKEFAMGERLVAMTLTVVTDDPSSPTVIKNTLDQATQSPWTLETAGASKIVLDSFPFNHDQAFMERMGRCTYIPAASCCRFLPLCSGTITKDVKPLNYHSQEGELTGFDLRDTPGSHTAVIAGTRSGKSFLVANILRSYLCSDKAPVVSIIDKRASYETLTQYHGGSVIVFTSDKLKSPDFPFHPLAGSLDDEHIEFLSSYIGLLAELAKPDQPVFAVDKVVITDALREAVQSLRVCAELTNEDGNSLTMSDIVKALGRNANPVARTLAGRLKPYYGAGTYAAYFDREHGASSLKADIISFDLDGLESDLLLQGAISQAILGQVMARMRKVSREGRWGILLMEEIGVLGDSIAGLAQFVADAWKTMAKLGVVCIGVTNDVEDYLRKPAAKAIWNNSPNKIYLRMTSDQIRTLVSSNEHGPAVVGGQLAELLPFLKTIPGEKADFIVSAEDRLYPLVFRPDNKSYWLGTSRHEDVLKLRDLAERVGIREAIDKQGEGGLGMRGNRRPPR
ncbi:MAG: hypothetical protein HYW48_02480 [Deltaproteobacteria bacterium]|nr:hypothetical protein [Deltaproteobacteria bacterium]